MRSYRSYNSTKKSGVEPQRRSNGILVTFRQLLHPDISPAVFNPDLPLEADMPGRESEAEDIAQLSFTLNKLTRKSSSPATTTGEDGNLSSRVDEYNSLSSSNADYS